MVLPIQVERLTKVYGSRPAVDRISFSVPQGHVFGLLGPNGAGKTTTIKLLIGLIRPTGGSIRILGDDLARHPVRCKSSIGHVYSNMGFYSQLTALENLTFLGRLHRIRSADLRKRNSEVLHFVGLWSVRNQRVGTYSQGMVQRLGIARAILHNPQVLLFDEATNGIDVKGVNAVRRLVYQFRALGKTIVIASHQLSEIELVSDTIGLLKDGKLISQGTPDSVIRSLQGVLHKYVVLVPHPIESFPASVTDYWFIGTSNIVIAGRDVEQALVERFGRERVRPVDPSLEEAFLWMLSDKCPSPRPTRTPAQTGADLDS